MSRFIPTPFSAEHEETQFMDHYSTMPNISQHVLIVVLFLAILAGIVILRDMLKTTEESKTFDLE
jgi:hypothetical protein